MTEQGLELKEFNTKKVNKSFLNSSRWSLVMSLELKSKTQDSTTA